MSFLTDYYLFNKVSVKAKTRMDCIASTGSYPVFEDMRSVKDSKETKTKDKINRGDFLMYVCDTSKNNNLSCRIDRKPSLSITIRNKHISGIYVPDLEHNPDIGYGDIARTCDAIIVLLDIEMENGAIKVGGSAEIFVARGLAKDKLALYVMACEGELDYEMEMLRARASNKAYDKERI